MAQPGRMKSPWAPFGCVWAFSMTSVSPTLKHSPSKKVVSVSLLVPKGGGLVRHLTGCTGSRGMTQVVAVVRAPNSNGSGVVWGKPT